MGCKTPTVIGFSDWTLAAPSSRRGSSFPRSIPPLDSSSRLGRLFRCYHGAHLIPGLEWKLRYVCLAVRAALALIFTCTLPFGVGAVERAQLLEDFQAVAQVFVHPRCANCHAAGDSPAQTDSGRPHSMNVQRGPAGVGVPGAYCVACHAPKPVSQDPVMPPAGKGWRMPGAETPMVFAGRTTQELCRQLKDPNATGRKSLRESLKHVVHDELVSWSFAPGAGRSRPPMGKKEFFKRLARWVKHGAPCP